MATLTPPLATVFGGSGFVGTQVVQQLARKGWRVRVAVRRPDLAGQVRMFGTVGQVQPIQANVRDPASVLRATDGANVVINLVGIATQGGKQQFDAIHVDGARNVATAARASGAIALVHMSILGADENSTSDVSRSRALGEKAALDAYPQAVIIRPSVIFGPGDGFFNLMGTLTRYFPILPLIGADTRFQPVYVGDVADAVLAAGEGKVKTARIYELGGPDVVTHRQIMQTILAETGRTNVLVPVPFGVGRLLAVPLGLLPNPILTSDQVEQLRSDSIVSELASRDKRTLAAFGVAPTPMGAILPSYLWRFRKHGQFDRQTA